MTPTTVTEVIEIVHKLKNQKSAGADNFSTMLIKSIAEYISPILCHVINLSFYSGVFPDKLKQSIVVPIYKKSNSSKTDNLRPISLVPVVSKIFEKIMKKRLMHFLESKQFISKDQYGFTQGRSTEDALINVTEQIYNKFNEKNKITGLFIDFKKAFDLVNHSILLDKLEAIGIRGNALRWFESYLTGRTQRVRIGDTLSPPQAVLSGVPQGAVLSANLFLIFINDLLMLPFIGKINAFADDIALFYYHNNSQIIWQNITEDLNFLSLWCAHNKMQVNVDKTKFINFDFKGFAFSQPLIYHESNCIKLNCTCKTIEQVDNFKYLGLTLDQKLNWGKHVADVHKKLRINVRKFYFLRNFCDIDLLRTLYYALVHSKLQYGIACWGSSFKYLIDRLRVTQNHYLRIIKKKTRIDSSYPLYLELDILPIQNLFIYKVLQIFFIRSGNRETNDFFYRTRSIENNYIKIPKVNKDVFRRSLEYLGPKYFNQLPVEIKKNRNRNKFKRNVYKWIIEKANIAFLNTILR